MSVVPEPHKWDTIPYMAGTLVYERKNELLEGLFFLFFCSIKTISEQCVMVKRKTCCCLLRILIDDICNLRF